MSRGLLLACIGMLVACGSGGELPGSGGEAQPSAPGPLVIELGPSSATTLDDLTVTVVQQATDPDGDVVGIRTTWWVDGVIRVGLTDQLVVSADDTSRGELWEVRASAIDSLGQVGPETGAQLTIQNSPPSMPVLRVIPEDPVAEVHPLHCIIEEPATDPDGDEVTYTFSWSVGGDLYPDSNPEVWVGPKETDYPGDTVPPEDTLPEQNWLCAARAWDADLRGPEAVAAVTIGTMPVVPDFSLPDINPSSATFGQQVSPRDYLQKASGWYFGHST